MIMTGQKYNKLTVLSEPYKVAQGKPLICDCKCDCGNLTVRRKQDLINGRIKSCGCLNLNSPVGKKFNKLTVISLSHNKEYIQENGTKQNVKFFECICECGDTTIVRQSALSSTLSCGCRQTEENKSRAKDVTGQTFTRLTAVEKDTELGKWKCSCVCGSEVLVRLAQLSNGSTKSCGCLQKEKASVSITNQHKEKRRSRGLPEDIPMSTQYNLERLEFKPLSLEIMKRDSFTCAWCSQKGGRLNVHHLDSWIEYPELRFTKTNLVTLCVGCHKSVHKNGNTTVDPFMNILLQGYANIVEDLSYGDIL